MDSHFIPEFAILGHPNEGKSAVVSTLSEDDSVKVSPTPGETLYCRIFPVRIDGKEIIRFTDTPGFQLPRQTLKWMEAYKGAEKSIASAFCETHKDNPDFRNECELFAPVERGAGIIFVVDGSRPIRKNDRMEMEILRLTGCPRMAIINSKGRDGEFLEAWKNEFRKSFNSVRVFNAHNANYAERIALLESLKAIDQDWQPALKKVIGTFKQDWKNRNTRAAEIICDLLVKCLGHAVVRTYADEAGGKAAKAQLESIYQEEIVAIEKKAYSRIRRLFKHNIFQVDLPLRSVINESLFAVRTWQVLGLSPRQLATVAAVGGGVIGAGLDLAAAGLTFGVFTAIGGAIGAGSAYFFGEQMAKAKVIGLRLGGYRVSVGPNKNMNFPYVLLDRALIYYSYIINWAHGRRDYPEDKLISTENAADKAGYTSEWDSREKKTCQSFLQAIRAGEDLQVEKSREKMVGLLLEVMEEISGSRTRTI
jgi:GTPase Era involved in 16S rRNA processing